MEDIALLLQPKPQPAKLVAEQVVLRPAVVVQPAQLRTDKLDLRFPEFDGLDVKLQPSLVGPPGPAGDASPASPAFSYTGGRLSSVLYADGSLKTLVWVAGRLAQVDFQRAGVAFTVRKSFSYNVDGTLAAIVESQV